MSTENRSVNCSYRAENEKMGKYRLEVVGSNMLLDIQKVHEMMNLLPEREFSNFVGTLLKMHF